MARNQVVSPSSIQITTYLLVIFAHCHEKSVSDMLEVAMARNKVVPLQAFKLQHTSCLSLFIA